MARNFGGRGMRREQADRRRSGAGSSRRAIAASIAAGPAGEQPDRIGVAEVDHLVGPAPGHPSAAVPSCSNRRMRMVGSPSGVEALRSRRPGTLPGSSGRRALPGRCSPGGRDPSTSPTGGRTTTRRSVSAFASATGRRVRSTGLRTSAARHPSYSTIQLGIVSTWHARTPRWNDRTARRAALPDFGHPVTRGALPPSAILCWLVLAQRTIFDRRQRRSVPRGEASPSTVSS